MVVDCGGGGSIWVSEIGGNCALARVEGVYGKILKQGTQMKAAFALDFCFILPFALGIGYDHIITIYLLLGERMDNGYKSLGRKSSESRRAATGSAFFFIGRRVSVESALHG